MKLLFISPRLAVQKGDFLGSGVPYWPIEAVTTATHCRNLGDEVLFVDLFGQNPQKLEDIGDYYLQGDAPCAALSKIQDVDLVILYAISYMSHGESLGMIKNIRRDYPTKKIVVLENSQAVTAYDISLLKEAFFDAGADGLICGEVYGNWEEIRCYLQTPSVSPRPLNFLPRSHATETVKRQFSKNETYPIPDWSLVYYRNYWSLPYAHGPKQRQYFPILTSRGCPFPCDFCVVPSTNSTRWRARQPTAVVEEILQLRDRFGVRHFHIEDLNPTVKSSRWREICEMLIEKQAGIFFYIVSGTKAETVPIEDVELYHRAGCRYISISPESGSRELMKVIGKRFDYDHAMNLVGRCRRAGIRTQACFLVGHPAETDKDFQETRLYLKRLLRSGLDETAIFIVSHFAGSALYKKQSLAVRDHALLPSFSPKGRENYCELERRRAILIRDFFFGKLKQGFSLWASGLRALLGRPQTKMENLPWRIIFVYWQIARYKFQRRLMHESL